MLSEIRPFVIGLSDGWVAARLRSKPMGECTALPKREVWLSVILP
jgi:hypothetical protein